MKYSSSARGRVARLLSVMFAASLVSGLMSYFVARAQPTEPTPAPSAATQPSAEEAAKREAWRATIARTLVPKKGCFTALYPNTEWQEAPCGPPSPYPNRPHGGHGLHQLDTVGNGTDYSAQVVGLIRDPGTLGSTIEHSAQVSGAAGRISSAVGSFDSVTPAAIAETGPWWTNKNCPPSPPPPCHPTEPCIHPDGGGGGGNAWCTVPKANAFSLQLNTQPFPTTACGQGVAECQGWQQFIFSQDQCDGPCVFIEYWLLNFGPSCPTSPPLSCPPGQTQPSPGQWTSNGENDCWFNSCSMPAPAVSAAQLQETTLTGTAGDMDTVVLTTAGTATAMKADSVLNLAQAWNTVEWNVFGDGEGFQANLSPGSTLVVRTSVNSGADIDCNVQLCNPPTCVQEGFTGETNNLFLVGTPAVVPASTLPAIVFTESNAADRTPASCTGTLGNISGGPPPPRQP
jgi:hypothetical protein